MKIHDVLRAYFFIIIITSFFSVSLFLWIFFATRALKQNLRAGVNF